jgi:hypothetical protein
MAVEKRDLLVKLTNILTAISANPSLSNLNEAGTEFINGLISSLITYHNNGEFSHPQILDELALKQALLTQLQRYAVDSGINATKVNIYDGYQNQINDKATGSQVVYKTGDQAIVGTKDFTSGNVLAKVKVDNDGNPDLNSVVNVEYVNTNITSLSNAFASAVNEVHSLADSNATQIAFFIDYFNTAVAVLTNEVSNMKQNHIFLGSANFGYDPIFLASGSTPTNVPSGQTFSEGNTFPTIQRNPSDPMPTDTLDGSYFLISYLPTPDATDTIVTRYEVITNEEYSLGVFIGLGSVGGQTALKVIADGYTTINGKVVPSENLQQKAERMDFEIQNGIN